MLKTIQIIAILQGLFLLLVLVKRHKEYKKVNFWLLASTVVSILLYALGDDNFNLFFKNTNWYFFHDILLVTCFFLLLKYHQSKEEKFHKKDLLFFIPYSIYVGMQLVEEFIGIKNSVFIVVPIILVAFVVFYYLLLIIKKIIYTDEDRWMLAFIIPYTVLYIIDRGADVFLDNHDNIAFLESYGVISLVAFLFYMILYKMIVSPKVVIEKSDEAKYKSSSLKKEEIPNIKAAIIHLLEEKKAFKNPKFTVNEMAKELGVPRQHLSEVLNIYMKISFQDLLNEYRVKEFIKALKDEHYKNYSLLGIANEVGFNSKTSFYTTFKKITGKTPNEYKKREQLDE